MSIGPTVLAQAAESMRKIRNSARFILGNIGDERLSGNVFRDHMSLVVQCGSRCYIVLTLSHRVTATLCMSCINSNKLPLKDMHRIISQKVSTLVLFRDF
jgi:hypothetical protein